MKPRRSEHAFPEWFEERVCYAFRAILVGGITRQLDFCDAWKKARDEFTEKWYDHAWTWTINSEDIFVCEAEVTEADIENAGKLAKKIGCELDCYRLANGSTRLIFSRFGWSNCDPMAAGTKFLATTS